MKISKFKMVTKFLFGGGIGAVVEYLLDILNAQLGSIEDAKKETVKKTLCTAVNVLNWLIDISPYVPYRWRDAFVGTVEAVEEVVKAFGDLNITKEEIASIKEKFNEAVVEWKKD